MARLGISQIKSMYAMVFIGTVRNNALELTVKKCSGYLRKRLIVYANERCELSFASDLSGGSVSVEVLDAGKNMLFVLSSERPSCVLSAAEKTRYRLVFRFDNASGRIGLGWGQTL